MSLGRIPTHKSTVHQIKWKLTGIESPSPCNFKHVSSISHHVLCESPHPHPDIRLLKSYPSFQIQLKGHLFHQAFFFFTLCQNLSFLPLFSLPKDFLPLLECLLHVALNDNYLRTSFSPMSPTY